jgi:hypothetical protein
MRRKPMTWGRYTALVVTLVLAGWLLASAIQ